MRRRMHQNYLPVSVSLWGKSFTPFIHKTINKFFINF